MRIFIKIIVLLICLSSCNNNDDKISILTREVQKLNKENYDLKEIIRNKYIFDTAEIRIIPSKNKLKNKSLKGEIVVVAYNKLDSAKIKTSRNSEYLNQQIENSSFKYNIEKKENEAMTIYITLDSGLEYGSKNLDYILEVPYYNL